MWHMIFVLDFIVIFIISYVIVGLSRPLIFQILINFIDIIDRLS